MDEQGWGMPPLQTEGPGPLAVRIARALRRGILEGRFRPGSRLPSSRALARSVGHSRPVVVAAFEQLRAEGWIEARRGSGTFVSSRLPEHPEERGTGDGTAPPPPTLSGVARRIARRVSGSGGAPWQRGAPLDSGQVDLRAGAVDRAGFPWVEWRRCLSRVTRQEESWSGVYEEPGGPLELRRLLAAYLARQRGVRTGPDRILVVGGSQQGLALVARLLVDPDSGVAVEDPCFPSAARVFEAAGAELHPVPVDGGGIRPAALPTDPGVRLLHLTPSHQFPTGGTLGIDRRLAVLEWAGRNDAMVLEDDYDGELRFRGRPVPSLQGQDESDRVIYLGSFSKIMLPELRLGYLVLPPSLIGIFRHAKWELDRHAPRLEALAAAEFIREGHLGRHVRRLRGRLSRRRALLVEELRGRFGDAIDLRGDEAGVHLMAGFPGLEAELGAALVESARREGTIVSLAHDCYSGTPPRTEILVGYSGSLTQDAIVRGVSTLHRAWAAVAT